MCNPVVCRLFVKSLFALYAVSVPGVVLVAQERDSEHVLFQAISRGDLELLKDLLRRGTPPDIRDGNRSTPLMVAAQHGSAEMVKMLLEHGADPRAVNERGVTALLWGARDVEKVQLLLDRGADPNARSELGNTPLMVAAASPSGADAAEVLLAHNADIAPKNEGGRTPLRIAANAGTSKPCVCCWRKLANWNNSKS